MKSICFLQYACYLDMLYVLILILLDVLFILLLLYIDIAGVISLLLF